MPEPQISISSEIGYNIPHIIKYMGSKKPILDFVTAAIDDLHPELVCDLFAGSCSISAALREKYDFISNDIQAYSAVLAETYFSNYSQFKPHELLDDIIREAAIHALRLRSLFPDCVVNYAEIKTLKDYASAEKLQRTLIDKTWGYDAFNLFSRFYSGTYWSFEQCAWIDAFRKTADSYQGTQIRECILSSVMYAMSYTTQSTGHFAQYRDGADREAMRDILTYRTKSFPELFKRKFTELIATLVKRSKTVTTITGDYSDCLVAMPANTTVYADPPYAPVHYSRFYHALETLVLYDYPQVRFKGRYRTDRHQSLFSKRGTVVAAFTDLFDKIATTRLQMVLSYSNNGLLDINELLTLARTRFETHGYQTKHKTLDYEHSTMGRLDDRTRDVTEYLVVATLT